MKLLSRISLLLLLVPAVMLGNDKFKGKYTKEKTLNKEYSVNANATLEVDNSYGNIDVVTWNENRIVIEVTIRTNGNNEERVQEKLNDIDVQFSGSSSRVTAETVFKGRKNNWSWWGSKKNKVSMEINYSIKMPVSNSVDLSNDYGGINLGDLDGTASISCDYGQMNIGELRGDGNYLNFDYTKNSTIDYMKTGKINADYSGFTVRRADRLELNADYSKSEIDNVNTLEYNCDYGKLTVGTVGNMTGQADYLPHNIGTVNGSLDLNTDYGSITVDRMSSSAGDVTIKSDYTGIKLGIASGYNFDFTLDMDYGSFKGKENVNVQHSSKDGSDRMYSGYHGQSGSGNNIRINSSYGGITFNKN